MAFATTELESFVETSGATAKRILIGTYASSGGSTGGVISPGTPSSGSAASGSTNIRKISFVTYTNTSATPSAIQSVVAYSATTDRDEVTITTAANQTGKYRIEGDDMGA